MFKKVLKKKLFNYTIFLVVVVAFGALPSCKTAKTVPPLATESSYEKNTYTTMKVEDFLHPAPPSPNPYTDNSDNLYYGNGVDKHTGDHEHTSESSAYTYTEDTISFDTAVSPEKGDPTTAAKEEIATSSEVIAKSEEKHDDAPSPHPHSGEITTNIESLPANINTPPPTAVFPPINAGYKLRDEEDLKPVAGYYRVQIAAFKNIPDERTRFLQKLANEEIYTEEIPKNMVRYMVGNFSSYSEAARKMHEMRKKGYRDAFVVSYSSTGVRQAIDK